MLHLNEKTKLKTGHLSSTEFFVSWDRIGEMLFQDYCDIKDVEYCNKLRTDYCNKIPGVKL